MAKLIMTKGLPASGKTTYAKKQKAKRINKDDLRAMIDDGKWSKENEELILEARNKLVRLFLGLWQDVIVDDTNLAEKHELELSEIAQEYDAEFIVKDFTDVPLSTCLKRDAERANSVGEKVIKRMYNSFLKSKVNVAQYPTVPFNEDLPNCIIVDIDGTLAHMNGRSPYDYKQVHTDVVDETVATLVRQQAARSLMSDMPETYIVIVSGRDNTCRKETEEWLRANDIPYDELYMRDPTQVDSRGNKLDDTIIKKEIYEDVIKPRFNVRFVLDDRDRVVKMWREQGLKVLQVAEGDF
jgi:predicted kinase